MKFQDARSHLSAYLDGELDEATRRQLEAALDAHPELRADLEALRRTADLVRSLPPQSAPPGFADRVMAAIGAPAEAVPRPAPAWLRRWTPAIVAAAACLVIGLATLLVSPPRSSREHARRLDHAEKEAHDRLVSEEAREQLEKGKLRKGEDLNLEAIKRRSGRDERAAKKFARAGSAADKLAAAATKNDQPRGPSKPAAVKDAYAVGRREHGAGPAPAAPPSPRPRVPTAPPSGRETVGRAMAKMRRAPLEPRAVPAAANGGLEDAPGYAEAAEARDLTRLAALIERQGPPASAHRSRADASPGAGGRAKDAALARKLSLEYRDLRRCLAGVRAALAEARVAYALQPQGSGQFVVTASVVQARASVLEARLRRAAGQAGGARGAGAAARRVAAEPGKGVEDLEGARAGQVRLVVQFRPATTPTSPRSP